jgi:uracil-DNA glycosylase
MRAVLQAISEELARLKAEGEQVVPVSEEALAGLRALVRVRSEAAGGPAAVEEVPPRAAVSLGIAERKDFASRAPAPATASVPSLKLSPAAPAIAALPPPPVISLPEGDKAVRWAALRDTATNHPVCLANVRPGKKAVLGVGSLDAKIFFVGEAPGAEEEVQGEPFVGPAGQLLTKMIVGMGLKREQVYIGNILCWRPQMPTPPGAEQIGNRPPTPEEMAFCLPFLRASIEIVQPDLLVALGGTAAQGLLGDKFTTLGAARSRWHDFSGKPLMVTYHPSYLLRNGSNKSKRMVWEDLLQVMEKAGLPISEKQRGYFLGA